VLPRAEPGDAGQTPRSPAIGDERLFSSLPPENTLTNVPQPTTDLLMLVAILVLIAIAVGFLAARLFMAASAARGGTEPKPGG
jgi:hypothetical protein